MGVIKVFLADKPVGQLEDFEYYKFEPNYFEVTSAVDGIRNLELTIERRESNYTSKIVSSLLTFYGSAYTYLYDKFIKSATPDDFVYAKIVDTCCTVTGQPYEILRGVIYRDTIEWCNYKCEIKADLRQFDQDIESNDGLESIVVWTDEFLTRDNHPLVHAYVEAFGGNKVDNFGIPSAYVRDYFENIATQLNLGFQSTIFSWDNLNGWTGDNYNITAADIKWPITGIPNGYNPYYELAVVFQNLDLSGINNGQRFPVQTADRYALNREAHAINWNGLEWMDNLAQVFNAAFLIRDGSLIFERKDYFYQNAEVWRDFSDRKTCFTISDFGLYAYLRLDFAEDDAFTDIPRINFGPCDTLDILNPNSLKVNIPDNPYQELVEWNDPYSPIQKRELSRVFDFFSSPHFYIELGNGNAPAGSRILYLDEYKVPTPKLVTLRPDTPINRKGIMENKDVIGGLDFVPDSGMKTGKQGFSCSNGAVLLQKNTLYENFHFIDDPRRRPNNEGFEGKWPIKGYDYTLTSPFNCQDLADFDMNKAIETSEGRVLMDKVTFKFATREVVIKGRI